MSGARHKPINLQPILTYFELSDTRLTSLKVIFSSSITEPCSNLRLLPSRSRQDVRNRLQVARVATLMLHPTPLPLAACRSRQDVRVRAQVAWSLARRALGPPSEPTRREWRRRAFFRRKWRHHSSGRCLLVVCVCCWCYNLIFRFYGLNRSKVTKICSSKDFTHKFYD